MYNIGLIHMAISIEQARYLGILRIDKEFRGDFSLRKKSIGNKFTEGLGKFFLGIEPQMGFGNILPILQQKAIYEDQDRTAIFSSVFDYNNLQLICYGGTPVSNRGKVVTGIKFFPDLDKPLASNTKNVPTSSYFSNFGVDSFTELDRNFLLKHFEYIPLSINEPFPLEIQWLSKQIVKEPSLLYSLKSLLLTGNYEISLQKMTQTPETVTNNIQLIAEASQGNWTTTWLPILIESGKMPNLTDIKNTHNIKDMQRPEERMMTDLKKLSLNEDSLQNMAKSIIFARDESLRIVVKDKNGVPLSQGTMNIVDEINKQLEPLRKQYARRKIQFDYSYERTDYPRKIFKVLAVFGTLTEVLEDCLKLPRIAKTIAGSGDDMVGEMGEIHALKAQGFTMEEIVIKRIGTLIPAALTAFYLSYKTVQDLVDKQEYFAAGVVFGVSSVLLSFVTALNSIKMFKKNLDNLIIDGKAPKMTEKERWIASFKQDFTNPLRAGIFLGVLASPVISGIAGALGLFNAPFLLPLLGQAESFGGLASSLGAEKRFKNQWNKFCLE
jgi:hypothetical protein